MNKPIPTTANVLGLITFNDTTTIDKSLKFMRDCISEYGHVTVSDLYDLLGVRANSITDKFGWTSVTDITFAIDDYSNYIMSLPEPVLLDEKPMPEKPEKYRKKPVVIEAIQFKGNVEAIKQFVGGDTCFGDGWLSVLTPEGPVLASLNDYIIKNVKGVIYPCNPGYFERTYERVNKNEL